MPLLLMVLLLMMMPGGADATVATVGQPALVQPVVETRARCSADPQVVVALTAFTPPSGGHATLVVTLLTSDGRRTELGNVAVFPEQAFAAPLAQAQRFGFALPKGALALDPKVMVELTVDGGTGARAVIGEARIGPAPGERC